MKQVFILTAFFLLPLRWSGSIYDINVETIDGDTINLASYQGRKILVMEFNAAAPDMDQVAFIDSLQTSNNGIKVVAIPATDFGGTVSVPYLKHLHDSLNLNILFTSPAAVMKSAGLLQHPLCKWLTDVNANGHFDNDIEDPGQVFIVGGQGTLYSILRKETPHPVLNEALNQQIN